MMKTLFLFLTLFLSFVASGQTAKLQVIHNSPTPGTDAGPTVDIYVDGALLPALTALSFRTATAYLEMPSGAALLLEVRVSPSTVSDPIVFTTTTAVLEENGLYQFIANGIVGDAVTPFDIVSNDEAQVVAAYEFDVDLQVFHGSPGGPSIDIGLRLFDNLASDLSYGNFLEDYQIVLPTENYLDVRINGSDEIAATYFADLNNTIGGAVTIFASGIFGGSPAFGLFLVRPDGSVEALEVAPVARVQFISNSPDSGLDFYQDDELLFINVNYKDGAGFLYQPADVEINYGVAFSPTNSSEDALVNIPITFENGKTYCVILNGVLGNSTTPFGLFIDDLALEKSNTDSTLVVSVFHGFNSGTAVAVDVTEPLKDLSIATNLGYGTHSSYVEIDTSNYDFAVSPAGTTNWVNLVEANFATFGGQAFKIVATGLAGNAGNPFDLTAYYSDGTALPLPAEALVQIVHNAPLPAAASVDVFVNGTEALSDFAFRDATPIFTLPAHDSIDFAVSVANSGIDAAAINLNNVVLAPGKFYSIYAAGDGSGSAPLALQISDATRFYPENNAEINIRTVHGSVDAPEVDINTGGLVFNNLAYGDFSDYVSLPTVVYILEVSPGNLPETIIAKYIADFTNAAGTVVDVFATGYLNPTGDKPPFGLWVALKDGTTYPLTLVTNTNEIEGVAGLRLSPNPAVMSSTLSFSNSLPAEYYLTVSNALGQIVQFTSLGKVSQGEFNYTLDTEVLPSGQYFVTLSHTSGFTTLPLQISR